MTLQNGHAVRPAIPSIINEALQSQQTLAVCDLPHPACDFAHDLPTTPEVPE